MILKTLVLVLISFALSDAQVGCPDGFEHHGDRCYGAFDVLATWIGAKMYCKVLGADLAVIESQGEETLIENILKKLYAITKHADDEGYWIDATDITAEGKWRWMGDDGQSRNISGYTHWSPGQPDNNRNQVTEQCMHVLYKFNMHWNDYPCHYQQRFICETGVGEPEVVIG